MQVRDIRQQAWRSNPALYFEECLKIEHKGCLREDCECRTNSARRAPFRLNRHQAKVQAAIDAQRRAGRPVRIIILKPRQTGISTLAAANIFHQVRFKAGIAMTVSMDLDSTEHIFGINQRFYHYLPQAEKDVLPTVASSRRELHFAEPHGGRILIQTAGKQAGGHSFTIRHLHLSEVARWPEGVDDTIIGLLNAVPDEPDTTIIIESVANGMSGWFYEEWHRPESDYTKIFLPWFEHDEYARPLPIPEPAYVSQLTPEEQQLIARYSLTLEQIEWRRWAIQNKCRDDKEKFKEQYPAMELEAFLSAGNSFFDRATLEAVEVSAPLRCDLRVFELPNGTKETRPMENPRGLIRLWKRPQPSGDYVIGVDVAEGIEIDGAPADDRRDYSCAQVLDRNTGEQVLELHGRITPDELGRQLAMLGRWYNTAFIAVENNAGYGQHTIQVLLDNGYPAHRLYRDPTSGKYGWTTTRQSKKVICTQLDMDIRRGQLHLHSRETIDELLRFVTRPDGKIEGGNGAKDDRVMALAIANRMIAYAPIVPRSLAAVPIGVTHYQRYYSRYLQRSVN